MSGHPPSSAGAGGPGTNMNMPPQQQGTAPPVQSMSQQNLNQIVIEYLNKKGYTRTEAILREESAHVDKDGRPIPQNENQGMEKYRKAFDLLSSWIDQNLDVYKTELRKVSWPVFIYSYLELVDASSKEATPFLRKFRWMFERVHADELRVLETITLPEHLQDSSIAKLYGKNKYRLPINTHAYFNMVTYLEANGKQGGNLIIYLLQTYCEVRETTRGPTDQYSFEAIISRAKGLSKEISVEELEGIPGAFTGVSNQDMTNNDVQLKLGPMQMETELRDDVRIELEEQDLKQPPVLGQPSLVEEFDANIKREESADAISRLEIPYPPSRARDVVMEVQKVKENRDRFRIEGRTGGVGPGVSVCMFTFHNTLDSISCIEFSDDQKLVACGTEESYIRVWNLSGEALTSTLPAGPNDPPANSRRLIGHSAPVYSVSFSPSIAAPEDAGRNIPPTGPRLLLSSSADKTIRLWSLDAWACLVVYKGHEGPVWNVKWSPFGHYFATCGWDKTVRVWGQDHISYLRMMVGHDSSVNQVAWHPNGAYVFSASDQVDKSVRMWSVTTGKCVRVFNGHTDFISALECAPNGKILASADGAGSIILWDLAKGTLIKRCRGHGRGGIWSLSFSAESTVLVSGGADNTVRVWDINVPADPYKDGANGELTSATAQSDAARLASGAAGTQNNTVATTGGSKRKGKDVVITPDQISAFPTKKSPVYKVKFTRMNLVMAGGCYLP